MIEQKDITFLVQGPIKMLKSWNLTLECLQSVRTYFPNSQLIFSTDYESDMQNFDVDQIVYSKPKISALIENDFTGHKMSVNYQISSTKAGLNKVTTPYTVKLRSDMVFRNSKLINVLSETPYRPKTQFTLTDSFVVILDWSTVDPRRFLKFPHHPSDHFFAGKTQDIKEIWDAPEMSHKLMRWFEAHNFPENVRHGYNLPLYRAESWIWYNYIKNIIENKFDNSYATSDKIIAESLNLMCCNLMITSSDLVGVYEKSLVKRDWKTNVKMLTYYDWVQVAKNNGIDVKHSKLNFRSIKTIFLRNVIEKMKLEPMLYRKLDVNKSK